MIGLGTLINAVLTVLGGLCGLLFGRALQERMQHMLICACGLCTLFIGASGALAQMLVISGSEIATTGTMLLIASLCIGGLIGEIVDIEARLEQFGQWLRTKSHSERDPRFIEGFTAASFTICIGAMAVIGPINDALYDDYTILIAKGVMDGIIVMALASSLGRGAIFSAVPLVLFQGTMTLLAHLIRPLMTPAALASISLVGSVLIFCVGINLVFGKKIRIANLLPAIVVCVIANRLGL